MLDSLLKALISPRGTVNYRLLLILGIGYVAWQVTVTSDRLSELRVRVAVIETKIAAAVAVGTNHVAALP